MKIEKVALLGAGAVGAYFIYGLSEKLGEHFFVCAKGSRKERLKHEGLIINGKSYFLNVKEPKEIGPVDLLFISTKQDGLADSLDDISLMVGENTIVLSLLNGVGSEELIGNAIGMEHMLYSFMRIASVRRGNEICFDPAITAGLFFGEKDQKMPTKRVQAVLELMEDTPVGCHFTEDILTEMWKKYAGNVSQNLPQAIASVGFGAYSDSEHLGYIAKCLWKEVSKIAQAKGIPLSEELELFTGSQDYARFSTLQDLDAKRHTEIEIFAGEMIRMGNEYGIPVPYCEYTYHMIKALEEKNDGKFVYEKE